MRYSTTVITILLINYTKSQQINQQDNNCKCISYHKCANNVLITDGNQAMSVIFPTSQCLNQNEICCKITDEREERVGISAKNKQQCGIRNVGGFEKFYEENLADLGEFPWMVAVLTFHTVKNLSLIVYQCGGSLIHEKVVLTSAHCVNQQKTYKVRAGEWNSLERHPLYPHQERFAKNIVIHPEFNRRNMFNDIALIFLESPFELRPHINIACLPKEPVIAPQYCFSGGWGKTVFGVPGGYSSTLKRIKQTLIDNQQCQSKLRSTVLGKWFYLHKSFVCAEGNVDTCKGDGGSPLVCPTANFKRYEVVGMVSWGIECGNKVPAVYANVSHFTNWIDKEIADYGIIDTHYHHIAEDTENVLLN